MEQTYQKAQVDRIFKMIDPWGFVELWEQALKDGNSDGKTLTQEDAFHLVNNEYHQYTRIWRYSSFECFKNVKKKYS